MGLGNKYVKACLKWFKRKRRKKERILSLFIGGLIFLIILPTIITLSGKYLDNRLEIYNIFPYPYDIIVGLILLFTGWIIAGWSVYVQYKTGLGTPVPTVPTQRLVTTGPYKYCRNPMVLGTLIFYMGLAFIFNSPSMIAVIIIMAIPLLIYIKLWEEKELEARFGKEYLEYKKRTPFIIPSIRRRKD